MKSTERVRDLAEVFTPAETVQAMLDLLPVDIWEPHPSPTFLEPACGDGNFLVAILHRKLERVEAAFNAGQLPAGEGRGALEFHALEALASIYAVDISPENVLGGVPGHEVGARERLISQFRDWFTQVSGGNLTARSPLLRSAWWVVDRNVIVGNMLELNGDGSASNRDSLSLVEYSWDSDAATVAVEQTTLGQILSEGRAETSGVLSFDFDVVDPNLAWTGPATSLHKAPIRAQVPSMQDDALIETG